MKTRKNLTVWLAMSMFLLSMVSTAVAQTIYVDDDGPAEFDNIQAAIDDSNDGDTIIVADGTYTGDGNRDIDFRGKAITVRSENGPEKCIIDCNGTKAERHRGFYNFHSGEDANSVLDGFTIINGYAAPGGGIRCYKSSPTITNCWIIGCSAGGTRSGRGGGIYCYRGRPIISNCRITSNFAAIGGGVAGPARIIDCIISGNSGGGGVSRAHSINNSTISGNTAEAGGGVSGGGSITNCRIIGNLATYKGGGISRPYGNIINCTFSQNSAPIGGGIYNIYGSPITITNCVLWGDTATSGSEIALGTSLYPSVLTLSYSDIQDGRTEVHVDPNCTLIWGQGNIDDDPCFVDPGYWGNRDDPNIVVEPNDPNAVWVDGDHHLLADSPCINAGDPNYIAEPNETDLDGRPRVIGGRIDMGAYEYSPPVPAEVRIVPRTINLTSKGKWITCHIWLPGDCDVADIDSNSILLEDEIQAESLRVDEQQQVAVARFSRSEVQGILAPGEVELTVSGELIDGTRFEGTDTIRVIVREPRPEAGAKSTASRK